jgi:ABC-2 type transport system permease protein
MLLSGFVFFLPGIPAPMQALSYLVPARHFITCTRGIYMKGVGADVLSNQLIFLAVFDLLMLVLTIMTFKKTLDVK